jgi:hypothetical protein
MQLPEYINANDTQLADFRECQLAALTAQVGALFVCRLNQDVRRLTNSLLY